MTNEAIFYKAEYESLRRKKNREIEELENKIGILVTNVTDYLEYKGLVNEYLCYTKAKELSKC